MAPGTVLARMGYVEEVRLRDAKKSGAPKKPTRAHNVGGIVTDGRFPPYMGG